jgi:hypothetical protein
LNSSNKSLLSEPKMIEVCVDDAYTRILIYCRICAQPTPRT